MCSREPREYNLFNKKKIEEKKMVSCSATIICESIT